MDPMRSSLTTATLMLVAATAATPALGSARYSITDLSARRAEALNNNGQVLYYTTPPAWMPGTPLDRALYNPVDGSTHAIEAINTPVPVPASSSTTAASATAPANFITRGFNDAGQIALNGSDGIGYVLNGGTLTPIAGPNAAPTWTNVAALNNQGDVAGVQYNLQAGQSTIFRTQGGEAQIIGQSQGSILIHDMNTAGQVVGTNIFEPNHARALVAGLDGLVHEVMIEGAQSAWATQINDNGLAAGGVEWSDSSRASSIVLFEADSTVRELARPDASVRWMPQSVVGLDNAGNLLANATSYLGDPYRPRAFLYADGAWTDLNDLIDPALGWTITSAVALNELGQILANGTLLKDGTTYQSSLLLTPGGLPVPISPSPVPEPSTLAVFGTLAAALAWRQRHRHSVAGV
jgi:hypothetical protein